MRYVKVVSCCSWIASAKIQLQEANDGTHEVARDRDRDPQSSSRGRKLLQTYTMQAKSGAEEDLQSLTNAVQRGCTAAALGDRNVGVDARVPFEL